MAGAIAGAALGGLINRDSSRRATNTQADSVRDANTIAKQTADQSLAFQREQYNQARIDNQQSRDMARGANNRLTQLMNNGQFDQRYAASDRASDPVLNASAGYMAPLHDFNQIDLNNDLVYQNGLKFGLEQGTQGINRQAAANSSFLSGATLKALTRFGNDYGSQKTGDAFNRFTNNQNTKYGQSVDSYNRYNNDKTNQFNRYAGIAGQGQQASNQVTAAGQNMVNQNSAAMSSYGQGAANNAIGLGNARASGYVQQGNALQNALNQGINAYSDWRSTPSNFNGLSDAFGLINTNRGSGD